MSFKCRRCRTVLFPEDFTCTAHGEALTENDCSHQRTDGVCYLKEDSVSDWMKIQFDKENWTKGKVLCPKCNCRIGSFNFVNGQRCPCGQMIVPPIHVVKAKVDCDNVKLS